MLILYNLILIAKNGTGDDAIQIDRDLLEIISSFIVADNVVKNLGTLNNFVSAAPFVGYAFIFKNIFINLGLMYEGVLKMNTNTEPKLTQHISYFFNNILTDALYIAALFADSTIEGVNFRGNVFQSPLTEEDYGKAIESDGYPRSDAAMYERSGNISSNWNVFGVPNNMRFLDLLFNAYQKFYGQDRNSLQTTQTVMHPDGTLTDEGKDMRKQIANSMPPIPGFD